MINHERVLGSPIRSLRRLLPHSLNPLQPQPPTRAEPALPSDLMSTRDPRRATCGVGNAGVPVDRRGSNVAGRGSTIPIPIAIPIPIPIPI